MKIWLVQRSESTPHDNTQSERAMRTGIMAQVLAQRGHQITWWTSTFDHFNHRHRYETDVCLEVSSNYKIQYIRGYGYQRNVSISRILDNNLVGKRFAQLIRKQTETPDIIIASIPTAELALEAVRYGRQHNIPVILDIRDLWPDVFYDLVPSYTHPVIDLITIPMTRKLEQACAGATSIVGLTEAFLNWGIKHANRLKNKNDQKLYPMGTITTLPMYDFKPTDELTTQAESYLSLLLDDNEEAKTPELVSLNNLINLVNLTDEEKIKFLGFSEERKNDFLIKKFKFMTILLSQEKMVDQNFYLN